jgi:CRP-like cAMP-binding protein
MISPFVRKLRHAAPLTEDDAQALDRLARPVATADPRQDILLEGDAPHSLPLILDGWACRYRHLVDGRRQIIAFLLPGDLCEPFGVLPRVMDHSLSALTPVRFARVHPADLRTLSTSSPHIEQALWWDLLVQASQQQERAVSLGRRQADERLAHLLCEMHLRLDLVGLAEPDGFDLPLTQTQIADALGLTAVHVNRTLRAFRKAGLVEWRSKRLTIRDSGGLRTLGLFDPAHFHLGGYDERAA